MVHKEGKDATGGRVCPPCLSQKVNAVGAEPALRAGCRGPPAGGKTPREAAGAPPPAATRTGGTFRGPGSPWGQPRGGFPAPK